MELIERVGAIDWQRITAELNERGYGTTGVVLTPKECREIAGHWVESDCFRASVVMGQHGFGEGEYRYFKYPLPQAIEDLRSSAYPHLAAIANDWAEALTQARRYPRQHSEFLEQCHAAGQSRPTPLILRYEPGDYNRLHQDLYGEQVFPLQMTFLLSDPLVDFSGGEFVLAEQRPRTQTKVEVAPLRQGEAVIFPVNHRPVAGTRGTYQLAMRHGVSRVRSGHRFTLGVIFHDAR